MEHYKVTLSDQERAELQGITSKGTHAASKVINALILLNCDQGGGRVERRRTCDIAQMLCVSERKVDRVKRKFVLEGLELTLNRQPSQCEYDLKIDGRLEAQLLAMSCSKPPQGQARWSLRLLAERMVELELVDSVSHETVRRTLKKNEIKPWRKVGWVIAPQASAAFVASMEKVLDIYSRPYDAKHPVVCMDETPRQLIRQTREPIAAAPGRPERHDYEYERCGVCNVFMASEPLAGRRLTKVTERRTKLDWAVFLQDIAQSYPDAQRITLVMDNLNTHTPASLYEAFTPAQAKSLWDRFEFVYTPKHGSWLNVAEIEINVMVSQCLDRRIDSIETVRSEVTAWQARRDNLQAKVNWQFTTEDARVKLKRLYPTISS